MFKLISIFLLSLWGIGLFSQTSYQGVIEDLNSNERIPFANIYTKDLKYISSSDEFGNFSINIPNEYNELVFSCIGYTPDTIFVTEILVNKGLIKLSASDYTLETITIVDEKIEVKTEYSTDIQSLSEAKVNKIPTILGQTDILKAYQILPGVQGNQEGFSGLQIRGGTSDQTSYYYDGARIYNTSHLFGFLSTFDQNSIKHSSLSKGGISASRGEGMSGNLELISKDGNKLKHEGLVDLGLLSIGGYFSGPLKKEIASYSISSRTTLYDWIIKGLSSGEAVVMGFYDVNGKIHYQNNKNTYQISVYTGNDNLSENNLNSSNKISWGNQAFSGRWSSSLNSKMTLDNILTWSKFNYNTILEYKDDKGGQYKSQYSTGIRDFGFDIKLNTQLRNQLYLISGVGFHLLDHKIGEFNVDSTANTIFSTDQIKSNNVSAYLELQKISLNKNEFSLGFRIANQNVQGRNFLLAEPRLRFSSRLNKYFSLTTTGQFTSQTIHRVNTSGLGLQTDLWIPSTDKIKPQKAAQISLGTDIHLDEKSKFSIEGFYKHYFNIIDLRDDASFATVYTYGPEVIRYNDRGDWQDQITNGIGYSKGLEFFYDGKISPKNDLLISYTLAYSKNKMPFVNNNNWYWSSTDRRHSFLINYEYLWKKNLSLYLNWTYSTGIRSTIPASRFESRGNFFFSYNAIPGRSEYFEVEEINNYSLPPSHRLDITLRKRGKKNPKNYWEVGLYNAYNRNNPFYIKFSNGQIIAKGLYPILPSFSYHIDLY